MLKMWYYIIISLVFAYIVICAKILGSPVSEGPAIVVPPFPRPMDNDVLLKMIAMTENWDGQSVGAAGERGDWQMLRSTWHHYSTEPFPWSRRGWAQPEAQRVLREHASWIRDEMEFHSLPQTPYTFALMWKAGETRVLHRRPRPVDYEYAERAHNIYKTLIK